MAVSLVKDVPAATETASAWTDNPAGARWYGIVVINRGDTNQSDYFDGYSTAEKRPTAMSGLIPANLRAMKGTRILESTVSMASGHPRWKPQSND